MKKLIVIISLFFLTSCNFNSVAVNLEEARKLEQEGRYEEAILLLNKVIEKDPDNIYALLDRGVDKSILKQYNGAITDYTLIIKIDPKNTLAYLNRGKNKQRLENYSSAIEDFEKAINTKGGEVIYINKVENSIIDNGFEFDVSMESIRYERGISRYHIDSLQLAFEDFNFCIEKNYEKKESLHWRGIIHMLFNSLDLGCDDLKEAYRLGNIDAENAINEYCGG